MLRSEIGRGEIKTVRIVTVIPSLVGFNELKKKSLTPNTIQPSLNNTLENGLNVNAI